MGACYTMQVIAKFSKENEEKFVNEIKETLLNRNMAEECKKQVRNCKSAKDVIEFVGAKHQEDFEENELDDGFVEYVSGFGATYSWEDVLLQVKEIFKKYAEKGSEFDYDNWG